MTRELLKGNEAIAEAAVRAGLDAYFGYPITPQTELLEYLARRMPELGRAFVQAESEVAAINMVYGAACTGKRVMTSSSGPGISLMQEGLSYLAGAELPAVVVDVMRGGPGLGNIAACQSDYFQVTRSAGHGDFRPLTLAPATIQEAIDLTRLAFDLAERYRMLVILLVDGNLGQMMEPAELPPFCQREPSLPEWALGGAEGRPPRIITSIYLQPEALERHNLALQAKLAAIAEREQRSSGMYLEDADLIVVAFGSAARVAQNAVEAARARHGGRVVPPDHPLPIPFPTPGAPDAARARVPGRRDECRSDDRRCAAGGWETHPGALLRSNGRRRDAAGRGVAGY